MRRDLVENQRAECPIQNIDCELLARRAPRVQLRMVAKINERKLLKRRVRLPTNAVAAVQNPGPFFGFNVLRLLLVGRIRRAAVTASIDSEVVEPSVITFW